MKKDDREEREEINQNENKSDNVVDPKPRKGSEWRHRLDEEVAQLDLHSAEKSLPKLDASEIHNYLDIIEKIVDQGKEGPLLKVLASLDRSVFIDAMRSWWNRLSPEAQSSLYHMEMGPLKVLPFFKTFVSLGFLEMKGVSSQELDKMEIKEVKDLTLAFKIVQFFMPELRPFAPLVKLANKMPGFKKEVRTYLIARREEDALKNKMKDHHVTPLPVSKKKPTQVVAGEKKKLKKAA